MTRFPRALKSFALVAVSATTLSLVNTPESTSEQSPDIALSPPLMLGGQRFWVGMSREMALARIAECCSLGSNHPEGAFVLDKDRQMIGSIHFRDGRVVGLRRFEKQSQDRAVADFVLAFYRSVLDGKTEARATVSLHARPEEGGNFSGHDVVFTFPNGRVLILKHAAVDGGTVVAEIIEER